MLNEALDLFNRRIDEELHGDGQTRSGVVATLISGAAKDYAVYTNICGYIRGLTAAQTIMRECIKELTDPPPPKPGDK